ncbi:hypothetical protein TREMEDRAFT_61261 [Tremella mesenterica DSM 1558]|uniref:uncharacterized protein n=1 Tax=Tremella mesenterica (strain ATCC 24925 / CBS 8224 / DSM 1558 / NBRC 9311 / NRRL Y-6157 / RJB 2259-6 / UBC 559-6) TaxID=578456 RepID=UPI0003F492F8|nr:uncharacterized protein TREMEDRAFT_61261 [Tremella mesenterica DSM 1558]EIW70754.1 hypothetical protein TREMEDRAFT_61261 [Tremella mesenterica DSM 1558]
MLHHRFNSNTTSTSHSSGIGPSKSAPPSNKTYTPLRRQSSGLYATPQSGTKVRYPMPSPNLTPYADGSPLPVYPSYPSSNGGYGVPDGPELSIQGNNPVLAVVRHGLDGLRLGLADAARLDRSWSLVWSDHELRSLVIKSTLINLLSLLLLSLWPLIFSPIFSTSTTSAISPTMQDKTREISMWYNLLLSWPVFIVCFWINASWSPDITRRAHTLLHPSYRFQPSPSPTPTSAGFSQQSNIESFVSNPIGWLMPSLTRITMISDFTLLTRIMCMIPTLGRWSAMGYMCIINSYYFFESTFLSRSWGLDHRISFMQERIGYMIGFGLPATVLTSFGPPLVNMVIFALIYPFSYGLLTFLILTSPPRSPDIGIVTTFPLS